MSNHLYSIKIASYNILNPYHAILWGNHEGFDMIDGQKSDNWHRRSPLLLHNLQRSGCAVACLQEVNPTTLCAFLPHYHAVGPSMHQTSCAADAHGVALLHDPLQVRLVGHPTQYCTLEGSGFAYRGELFADYEHLASGARFRVGTTHLKGYDPKRAGLRVRREGYLQLHAVIQRMMRAEKPQGSAAGDEEGRSAEHVVLAGDFNEDAEQLEKEQSRVALMTKEWGFQHDGDLSPTENHTGRKIDWLLHRYLGDKSAPTLVHLDDAIFDHSASDHHLSVTEILFS